MQESKGHTGMLRRTIGLVLLVFVLLFMVYLSAIMLNRINTVVFKDKYCTIFHYELILCGILLLFSLDLRFGVFTKLRPAAFRILGLSSRIVVAVLATLILVFFVKVVIGGRINTAGEAEHAIVLGMALQNGKPEQDLISRIEAAKEYLDDHPNAVLVLSGGNPDDSGVTEADVMRNLLLERGVPDEKMVLERESASTDENFINSAKLMDSCEPVVLISSSYHMDRAVMMARKAGFQKCLRLPAASDPFHYGANVMWEVMLELNEAVNGR